MYGEIQHRLRRVALAMDSLAFNLVMLFWVRSSLPSGLCCTNAAALRSFWKALSCWKRELAMSPALFVRLWALFSSSWRLLSNSFKRWRLNIRWNIYFVNTLLVNNFFRNLNWKTRLFLWCLSWTPTAGTKCLWWQKSKLSALWGEGPTE